MNQPSPPYTPSRWHHLWTGLLSFAGFGCSVWVTGWMGWRVAQQQHQDTADSAIYAFTMAVIPFCVMYVLDATRHPDDAWRPAAGFGRFLLLGLLVSYGWGVADVFRAQGVGLKDAVIGGVLFAVVAALGPWMLSQWLVSWFRRREQPTAPASEPTAE